MDSETAEEHPSAAKPMADAKAEKTDEHEHDVEDREAFEAWDYLFKPDKTGTDKLKALLRGLKDMINEHYEPSDNPDLTPSQLASFYRDLDGNYDQLFLGTPGASIAFIYKSLGCLHSLQPLPHSATYTDPTVPALKTEGWIMWQTIQVLLGPDEHSVFLMEAVKRWDIKDPSTGEILPKILPRQCFPPTPDKHMVAWYEGVSERLRTEAEEEIRKIEDEKEADRSRVALRPGHDTDDEESVDSRGPALAYFRNPLYRHVDGKSGVAPPESRRSAVSPRPPSLRARSREAASKFGNVVRNAASSRHSSRNASRDRERDRRRKSLPHHMPGDPPPERDPYDEQLPPPAPMQPRRSSRRRSSRLEPRPHLKRPDDEWEAEEDSATPFSREPSPRPPSGNRPRPDPRDFNDPRLRHSRSHEPTPTQREGDDYFQAGEPPSRRRASAYDESPDVPPPQHQQSGFGPSFAPSNAPLFASHVARQPPPFPPNGVGRDGQLPGPPPPQMNYDPRQYPGPPNRRPRPRHPDYDMPPPPSRSRTRRHSRSPPPRHRGPRRSGSRPRPPPPPYDDRYPSPGRGPGPEPRRRSRPPPGPGPRYSDPRDMSPGGPGPEPRRRSRPPPGPPPGAYDDPRDLSPGSPGPDPRRRPRPPPGPPPGPYDDPRDMSPGSPGPEPRRRPRPPPGPPSGPYDDPRDMSPGSPGPEPRRRPRPPPPGPPGPRYSDSRSDLYSSDEESMSPPPSPDDRRARRNSRRKSRGAGEEFARGSDVDGFYSAPEGPDRRAGPARPKVTRFANEPVSGVDGRRYPGEMPRR